MRRSRFGEDRIIGALRGQEAGGTTAEACRRHGIGEQTFARWKAKYGGMEPSDAARPRSLEDETRRLKKLLAAAMPDVAAHAPQATSLLSLAHLRAAHVSAVGERLHELSLSVLAGKPAGGASGVAALSEVYHHSPWDALAGCLIAFRATRQKAATGAPSPGTVQSRAPRRSRLPPSVTST